MSTLESTTTIAPAGTTWAADPVHSDVAFEIEYSVHGVADGLATTEFGLGFGDGIETSFDLGEVVGRAQ